MSGEGAYISYVHFHNARFITPSTQRDYVLYGYSGLTKEQNIRAYHLTLYPESSMLALKEFGKSDQIYIYTA